MSFSFGGATQQPSLGFGATPAKSTFGNTSFGFGGTPTAATTTANTTFGGFGSSFGTPASTAAPAFGSSFGAPATSTAPTGAFGSTFGSPAQTSTSAAPAFGSTFGGLATSSAPTFGSTFGAQPTTSTAAPNFGGFGSFGTTSTPATAGNLFSGFGATPASSASAPTGFGGFGGFGTTTTASAASGGFGGFGGGFGAKTTSNTQPTFTGFGSSLGQLSLGLGLLGQQQQQQQQQQQARRPMANISSNLNTPLTGPPTNNSLVGGANSDVSAVGAQRVVQPPQPDKFNAAGGRVIQPRHGPFYGHNPNLKLPSDLFLMGCIFVVVEVERYLEETSPDWRAVIEKYGGEIEPVYCARVTHVLCETQRHGVVMQALRDFKRCVTLFWLDDCVKRKQVLPPWQALHLPTGYVDGAPASRHLVALSGFNGPDRNRVKEMIKYTGAKFTNYFSRHNTVLVCGKTDGKKYQHAKKWGTPVVNVQWLTDLMLGNFSALNQIEHAKYQQFPQQIQLGFDTGLVTNLMYAWKMPINISQESYERVKRTLPLPILPKAKKPKLEPIQLSEEENIPKDASPVTAHRILFSRINPKEKPNFEKMVLQLGGSVVTNLEDATHLVMPSLARSEKLLFAIIAGVQIVPDTWLKKSNDESHFLDESEFKFDTREFDEHFGCDFYKTLSTPNRTKLFENKTFYITPSVCPNYKTVRALVERSGGLVEKQRRTLQQIQQANVNAPHSYIIITMQNDLHLVYDCLRTNKDDKIKYIGSSEVVMMAILTQNFQMNDSYLVKVY